jgi:ubiquinone/menaquinone biosynthesis C-methylase UbiE
MAIEEIHRVLKPGGKCVIMLYHKGYAYYLLLLRYAPLFIKSKLKDNLDILTSQYDHTPLSRMYSKKETRELFRKFNHLEVEMTTYGGIQKHRLLRYMHKLLNKSCFLMNRFGSYLLIKGRK